MMRRVWFLSIFLLLSFSSLHAQKRAFAIEDLYRVKNISDLQVKPVIYTVIFFDQFRPKRTKRTSGLWVVTNKRQTPVKTTGDKTASALGRTARLSPVPSVT